VIEVRQAVLDSILAHALEAAPQECCGLLIGNRGRIERAARARNLAPSPTRYLIDPADHFAALRAAREAGLAVIGAYHSHPASPPTPSQTDRAEISYPDYLYLIIGPERAGSLPVPRAYLPRDRDFEPILLVTVP
jgi:desampylase